MQVIDAIDKQLARRHAFANTYACIYAHARAAGAPIRDARERARDATRSSLSWKYVPSDEECKVLEMIVDDELQNVGLLRGNGVHA